jgi:hypothetical protein
MSSWLPAFRAGVEAASLERLLKAGGDAERDALLAEARHALEMHGLRELHVLQTSPAKARSVILCDHPELGRCVLKFVSSQAASGVALAHTESIRRGSRVGPCVVSCRFPCRPRFQHRGVHRRHDLCISCQTKRWASVELAGFFAQLRSFETGGGVDSTSIGPAECKIIVFRFLRKDRALIALRDPPALALCGVDSDTQGGAAARYPASRNGNAQSASKPGFHQTSHRRTWSAQATPASCTSSMSST